MPEIHTEFRNAKYGYKILNPIILLNNLYKTVLMIYLINFII